MGAAGFEPATSRGSDPYVEIVKAALPPSSQGLEAAGLQG